MVAAVAAPSKDRITAHSNQKLKKRVLKKKKTA